MVKSAFLAWVGAGLFALSVSGAAEAATESYTTFEYVRLTDFADKDAACTNGGSTSCSTTQLKTASVSLDAFNTELGTLNRVELSYYGELDGIFILRGDDILAPDGSYSTEFGTKFRGTTLSSKSVSSTSPSNGAFSDSSTFDYSTSLWGSRTLTGASLDPFVNVATSRDFTFFFTLSAGLSDCIFAGIIKTDTCGATNRVTAITSAYDVGPVILREVFSVTATYYYDTFPEPPEPPAPVPLPGGMSLAFAGVAIFAISGARGRRRS